MAEERSDKSPFQSRFGGGYITPQAFIAEAMCERIANKNKVVLPLRFWNVERWKRDFLLQLRFATSLIKLYPYDAIVKALRTPEGKKIYSLGANWLDPLIRKEHDKIKRDQVARQNQVVTPVPVVVIEKPRPPYQSKTSVLDKLRELD